MSKTVKEHFEMLINATKQKLPNIVRATTKLLTSLSIIHRKADGTVDKADECAHYVILVTKTLLRHVEDVFDILSTIHKMHLLLQGDETVSKIQEITTLQGVDSLLQQAGTLLFESWKMLEKRRVHRWLESNNHMCDKIMDNLQTIRKELSIYGRNIPQCRNQLYIIFIRTQNIDREFSAKSIGRDCYSRHFYLIMASL